MRVGVAIACAIILISNAAPTIAANDSAPANDVAAQVANATEVLPEPAVAPDKGCPNANEDRSSEICAAWKAADVGESAALWAFIQMILSVGGFLGLIATLYYTRKATNAAAAANADTAASLQVAKQNADATEALVRVAEENARRELRAYLDFEEASFLSKPEKDTSTDGAVGFRSKLKNYGRTPATDVVLTTNIYFVDQIGGQRSAPKVDVSNLGMIAPGDHCGHNCWLKVPLALATELRQSRKFLEVEVSVTYADVFRQTQTTISAFEGSEHQGFGVIDGTRSWS